MADRTQADPDGSGALFAPITDYIYDNVGRLKATDDPLGRTTAFEYNQRDWLTKVTEPDPDWTSGSQTSPVTQFGYDNAGRQTTVTDPLGRVTTTAFDAVGRVTSVTGADPDGTGGPLTSPVTSYLYNAMGSRTRITDPLGKQINYSYDLLQRRLTETLPDPDDGGPLSSPVTTWVYDSRGLLSTVVDPLSRNTTYSYDAAARTTGVADHLGNTTTYGYDLNNNRTSMVSPDPDGGGPLTASTTTYTFDTLNRLTVETLPGGSATTYTFDAVGNTLSLEDPAGNTTSWAYDNLNRATIETNSLGHARSFTWDAAGRLTDKKDGAARVTEFVYDELDRMTAEKWLTGAGTPPSISVSTTTNGGPINEVQRVGHTVTGGAFTGGTFKLTHSGSTTGNIAYNASAATVQSALEGLASVGAGNVIVTKIQDITSAQEWEVTFVNGKGNSNVAQTIVNNTSVTVTSGTKGKIETTPTPGQASGNEVQVVSLSNSTGGTFRLAVEGETTFPIPYNATAAQVDAALEDLNIVDNVSVTGTGPWTVTFQGSQANTNVSQMLADATSLNSGTVSKTLTYGYNAANELTSAGDTATASFTFGYDNLGRMTQEVHTYVGVTNSVTFDKTYDAASRRTSLAAKIGTTKDFANDWTYDNLGRMTQVKQHNQTGGNAVAEKRVDFAYNAASQFSSIKRWSDLAATASVADTFFLYDTNNRLTDIDHKDGSTLLHGYDYVYDNMSRITSITSSVDGATAYTYDGQSQLTNSNPPGTSNDENFTYDANGNRTVYNGVTNSIGDNNRLLSDGTYTYEYDNEGNRTKRTHSSGTVTEYTWDHKNRLTQIKERSSSAGPITKQIDYTYDLFGRRIKKLIDADGAGSGSAVATWYFYDGFRAERGNAGDHIVLQLDNAAAVDHRYLYGPAVDQILADEDITTTSSPGTNLWDLTDHLGTVRDLVNNSGTVQNHITYTAFGKVVAESGPSVDHLFGFTGRERDEESGLQFHRARYYDPAVGRWLSQDPEGFGAGDTNLTRFVSNMVTKYKDPSGRMIFDFYGAGVMDDDGTVRGASVFLDAVPNYAYYLTNPWEMDDDLEMLFYASLGVSATAIVTANAIVFFELIPAGIMTMLAREVVDEGIDYVAEAYFGVIVPPTSVLDSAQFMLKRVGKNMLKNGGEAFTKRMADEVAEGALKDSKKVDLNFPMSAKKGDIGCFISGTPVVIGFEEGVVISDPTETGESTSSESTQIDRSTLALVMVGSVSMMTAIGSQAVRSRSRRRQRWAGGSLHADCAYATEAEFLVEPLWNAARGLLADDCVHPSLVGRRSPLQPTLARGRA